MADAGGGPTDGDDVEDSIALAEWADWNTATFTPLEELDAGLADELRLLLASTFLAHAGLSGARLGSARDQCRVERGRTEKGFTILRAHLPHGAGSPQSEWDGSESDARAIIVEMGETAGRTVRAERARVGPTGWEPEFDS